MSSSCYNKIIILTFKQTIYYADPVPYKLITCTTHRPTENNSLIIFENGFINLILIVARLHIMQHPNARK